MTVTPERASPTPKRRETRAVVLRERSRERIMRALMSGGEATRTQLTERCGLSRATVSSVVGELQREGMLVESPADPSSIEASTGRPATTLRLHRSLGVAVGIDLGHSHVRVALADLSHTVLGEACREVAVDEDPRGGLDAAAQLVEDVIRAAGAAGSPVMGVGVGVPGPINRRSGTFGSPNVMPRWADVQVAQAISDRLGTPVSVDNDANLGALAEYTWGAAVGHGSMVYVKASSGLGAGFVIDGQLYRGARGMAGEIGHVTLNVRGGPCECGSRGCAGMYIDGGSLMPAPRAPRLAGRAELDMALLLGLLGAGDAPTRRAFRKAGTHLGYAVASLCNLFDPEMVVVGGDITRAGEALFGPLRHVVSVASLHASGEGVEIAEAALGPRAEALGALALVLTGQGEREMSSMTDGGPDSLARAASVHVV